MAISFYFNGFDSQTNLCTVASKVASSKTIAGDFPPSSNVTRFKLLFNASSWIALPTLIEPVKLIFAMLGCDARASPVV